jgi:deoxyribodipyrimidine photolyase-related protein
MSAAGHPFASVEGFVRQILGWHEFIRGIYWRHMPAHLEQNSLDAHQPLPPFYNKLTHRQAIQTVIEETRS